MGARIFLVAKPFCGYQHVFYSVTLTLESYFFLTLTFALANNLWTLSARALIFHMNILWDKAFSWKQIIWPCDLDIRVWPTFSKLYLANNFWIVSGRALIFHMNIPCDEIFLLILNLLTLTFDQFKKKNDIGHNFLRASILHMVISCDKIFLLVTKYLSLWFWPSLELTIIGGIVFHKHIMLDYRYISLKIICSLVILKLHSWIMGY